MSDDFVCVTRNNLLGLEALAASVATLISGLNGLGANSAFIAKWLSDFDKYRCFIWYMGSLKLP